MSEQDELLLTGDEILRATRELRNERIRYTSKPVTRAEEDEALCEAQLAKVKQHYEQEIRELRIEVGSVAFEKGKKYSEQKKLDRPELRKKIHDKIVTLAVGIMIIVGKLKPEDLEEADKNKFEQVCDAISKQIEALIPDIEEEREKVAELIKGLLTPKEAQGRVEEAKKQERIEIANALEQWMDEASPYRKIAQVEHAIIRLKRGQAL